MLGQAQLDWLRSQLSVSRAKWKILGNQTQLMSVKRPIIPGQSNGGFLTLDAWDGYPAERLKLLNFIRSQNISNVAVITGDIHSSWAADIPLDPFSTQSYTPQTGAGSLAVEFVTPSVTASNFDEVFPLPRALITQFLINPSLPINPHVKMLEGFENGYMVIDVANDKMQSDWFFVDTLKLRTTRERFYQGWLTTDGSKRLTQAAAPAPAKTNAPVAAPIATSVATNDPTLATNNRSGFAVIGNYPNPASEATVINYVLAMPKHVVIKLYDIAGKELYTLLDERQSPGNYGIALSVSKFPTGTYFYRCEMDGVSVTRSLSVVR
jgi:alkaline phosphatase D